MQPATDRRPRGGAQRGVPIPQLGSFCTQLPKEGAETRTSADSTPKPRHPDGRTRACTRMQTQARGTHARSPTRVDVIRPLASAHSRARARPPRGPGAAPAQSSGPEESPVRPAWPGPGTRSAQDPLSGQRSPGSAAVSREDVVRSAPGDPSRAGPPWHSPILILTLWKTRSPSSSTAMLRAAPPPAGARRALPKRAPGPGGSAAAAGKGGGAGEEQSERRSGGGQGRNSKFRPQSRSGAAGPRALPAAPSLPRGSRPPAPPSYPLVPSSWPRAEAGIGSSALYPDPSLHWSNPERGGDRTIPPTAEIQPFVGRRLGGGICRTPPSTQYSFPLAEPWRGAGRLQRRDPKDRSCGAPWRQYWLCWDGGLWLW
jgi:hypothetical protein